MSAAQHTPETFILHLETAFVRDAKGCAVASFYGRDGYPDRDDASDARTLLFCAAPDMELSLRELLEEVDFEIEQRQDGGNDEDWLELKAKSDRGHAALAKAAGAPSNG